MDREIEKLLGQMDCPVLKSVAENDLRQRLIDAKATPAEVDALLGAKKKNKYHATRTEYNGRWYDSKGEAECSASIDILKKMGEILWVLYQVPIPLGADDKVRIDFVVARYNGCDFIKFGSEDIDQAFDVYAVDFKGKETRDWVRKAKLWAKYGPFPLHVISSKGTKIINPGE